MNSSLNDNDEKMIADLRLQFRKKYIDPPSEKAENFDDRDVQRIWNDDLYALSFVHWKKEVIKDAVELVSQSLEWRKQNGVPDLSVDEIGEAFIKRGICYLYGRALDGTRVLSLIGRLQTKDDKDKLRNLFSFMLERLQRYETGQHITFILDCHKTSMTNVDLGMIKFIIDSFTLYFPDLLERIIILDMPWIMNAIWNIVKQWMSEEQRSKVAFCGRKDLKKFIAVEERPKSMAGTVDWEYSFPPFPDELGQDRDFKDGPKNFARDREPDGAASTPVKGEQVNGDVKHEGRVNNINADTKEKITLKKKARELEGEELPTTSNAAPVKNGGPSLDNGDGQSSSLKRSPRDYSEQNGGTSLKRRGGSSEQLSRLQSNMSFMSIAPAQFDELNDGIPPKTPEMKNEVSELDEITLGKLLRMSPVSELAFALVEERLEGYINIRNPNPSTADKKVYVAFKVKTTSPDLYHVKPSIGLVPPEGSTRIRIYVKTGHESAMSKDRFLLLYKQYPVEDEDGLPSHAEIIKFWKKYSDKSAHHEHRIRVKVDGLVVPDDPKHKESKPTAQDITVASSTSASSGSLSFLSQEHTPKNSGAVELTQLQQQMSMLCKKMARLESDTRWMRRRMRHTMGLLLVVIVLLLFVLYEVIMVSYRSNETTSGSAKIDL